MKQNLILSTFACAFLCSSLCAQASKNESNEISNLQQERLSALASVVDEAQRCYDEVVGDFDTLLRARRNWLCAFLDATEKKEARIAAVEKHLEFETKAFNTVKSAATHGLASPAQVFEAKAKILEFKILLLRETFGKSAAK
jgi:hypothetical protein